MGHSVVLHGSLGSLDDSLFLIGALGLAFVALWFSAYAFMSNKQPSDAAAEEDEGPPPA